MPWPARLTGMHASTCTERLFLLHSFVSCSFVTVAENAQRDAKKDACIAQLREELGRLKSQCSQVEAQVHNDRAMQHSLSKLLVILLIGTCTSAALLEHYMHWHSLNDHFVFAHLCQMMNMTTARLQACMSTADGFCCLVVAGSGQGRL